ncbi:hypothetical protein BH10BAC6_BH10BAC6_07040 [soil metagenome]
MRTFLVVFLAALLPATAQWSGGNPRAVETFAIRLMGGVVASNYTASFSQTGPIIDCGTLSGGSGLGPSVSAIAEIPFSQRLGLGLGVSYVGRNGTLKNNGQFLLRDLANNRDVVVTTEHAVAAMFSCIEVQPDIRIPLIGETRTSPLGLAIGPRIAFPLSATYTQTESIVEPDNAYLLVNGQQLQTRTVSSGNITTHAAVLFGVSAALESKIRLSDGWAITPQVSFDYFLNSLVSDASWKTWGVRFEIGVRMGNIDYEEPPPPPPPVVVPAVIAATPSIDVNFNGFRGAVLTGNQLKASVPIVPAVFFDSASADIPSRYITSNIDAVNADAIQAHYQIIPRIAKILRDNPKATVVLDGATSGPSTESEGPALARRRANSVKNALKDLGVEDRRISVLGSVQPAVPSNQDYAEGRVENRRTDITVVNAQVQEWVSAEQFARLKGDAILNVRTNMKSGTPITLVVASVTDTTIKYTGQSTIPFEIPVATSAETIRVTARAQGGGATTLVDTLLDLRTIARQQVALEADDFEAVLRFDYNSAELTEDVKSLLRQLREKLPAHSTISINGSADVLGSDARNKALSEQRAQITEKFIQGLPGASFTFTTGTTTEKFSDETPQGRFLNRCIRIRVQPAKN